MNHHFITLALIATMAASGYAAEARLSGSLISSSTGLSTHDKTKVNDGNTSTYFQVNSINDEYSRTWIGYDLGEPCVVTGVRFAAAPGFEDRMELALFEGANRSDFSDAIPIAMVKAKPVGGTLYKLNVTCSRGFRYVRVMAPSNKGCTVGELEFLGYKGEGDDTHHFQITNLPTVVINTEGMAQIMSKDHKVPGFVYIVSDNGRTLQTQDNTEVKGRGNGSWTFPKKPYRLKFDKKTSVLDAPAKAKKWTLISNYGDKSLMRNKLAFDISQTAGMAYSPYCRFVDVVMNGQYEGTYQLCDQVDVRKHRVDITEMSPSDTFGSELTGGYFVEIDAYASSEISWFTSDYGQPVTIKSPDDDVIVAEQSKYIRDHFNKMERAVMTTLSSAPDGGYTRYLDLDSYLRFIFINELAGNTDILWSVYMYKQRDDDHFYAGPVWDFDIAFENDRRVYPVAEMNDYMFHYNIYMASTATREMTDRIVEDDDNAVKRLSQLWSRARLVDGLTYSDMCDRIDRYAAELDQSQALNFRRWPVLDAIVHQNPVALGSYKAEVERIKQYLEKRFEKLDERFVLDTTVGIETVGDGMNERVSVGCYDMLGRKINRPAEGLYIERFSDGSSEKRFAVQ